VKEVKLDRRKTNRERLEEKLELMRKSQSIFLKTKLPAMMELLSPRWSNDCFPDVEKTWTV
jgi:hypothetical protein